jgi:hypothetical protein
MVERQATGFTSEALTTRKAGTTSLTSQFLAIKAASTVSLYAPSNRITIRAHKEKAMLRFPEHRFLNR